jgi:hypothetical protein
MTRTEKKASQHFTTIAIGGMTLYAALLGLSAFVEFVA